MDADIITAPQADPGPRCADCAYFHALEGDEGECRESPPKVHLVPVPHKLDPKQVGLQPVSIWPRMVGSAWCGAFMTGAEPSDLS